jgi:hypothetical protein
VRVISDTLSPPSSRPVPRLLRSDPTPPLRTEWRPGLLVALAQPQRSEYFYPTPAPVVGVAPHVWQVRALVALGVVSFASLGAAVAVIAALTGSDYMHGFKRLLDLNTERNLPTWFSSTALLTAAALLGGIATDERRRHRPAWRFLAIVFVGLSVDETASIHEMTNAPLRALLHSGPALYFPWILGGLLLASVVLIVEWGLLRALPRRTSVAFVIAGATYVTGAAGFEAIAAPLYARHVHPIVQAALVTTEESLEMIGVALFIVALTRFWAIQGVTVTFGFDTRTRPYTPGGAMRLSPRRVFRILLLVAAGLAAVNLGLQAVHFLTPLKIPGTVRLFDLAREGNVPTWVQSNTLLACAALTGLIAAAEWQRKSPFRVHWVLTALFCVYLSADEAASIHEMSVKPLRDAFHTSGLLYYPWIVIGLAVSVAVAAASRRFLVSLPPRTRWTVVLAAIIYLAGALGVESLGALYAETHGRRNLAYGVFTTVEETLEMIGMSVAVLALLEYLRDCIGPVRFAIAGWPRPL